MKYLFSMLLVAAFAGAGAQALAAQQPHDTAAMKTHHHHARHAARAVRHARTTYRATMTTPPTVLGTPVSGFPMPPQPAATTLVTTTRMPRLANGLITLDAARRIALRTVPGGTSVTKIHRHTDDGRLVYDVKVTTPNQTGNEMVRVDAHTGAVVESKNVDNPVGAVKGAVNKVVNKVKHP